METFVSSEKCIFGKKLRLDVAAQQSIGRVITFVNKAGSAGGHEEMENDEADLINHYYTMIEALKSCILPFWWQDYFAIETELKSLVTQIAIFTGKARYMPDRKPFDSLIEREITILEKIKKYFEEFIMKNDESGQVLIDDIKADIKEQQKDLVRHFENRPAHNDFAKYLMVLDVFEKASLINSRITNLVHRINLGAVV